MKITKTQLRKIIKEELSRALLEQEKESRTGWSGWQHPVEPGPAEWRAGDPEEAREMIDSFSESESQAAESSGQQDPDVVYNIVQGNTDLERAVQGFSTGNPVLQDSTSTPGRYARAFLVMTPDEVIDLARIIKRRARSKDALEVGQTQLAQDFDGFNFSHPTPNFPIDIIDFGDLHYYRPQDRSQFADELISLMRRVKGFISSRARADRQEERRMSRFGRQYDRRLDRASEPDS